MVCLTNTESDEAESSVIKQQTSAWQKIREYSIATGSTINKAIGLEGLKKQKELSCKKLEKWNNPRYQMIFRKNLIMDQRTI